MLYYDAYDNDEECMLYRTRTKLLIAIPNMAVWMFNRSCHQVSHIKSEYVCACTLVL